MGAHLNRKNLLLLLVILILAIFQLRLYTVLISHKNTKIKKQNYEITFHSPAFREHVFAPLTPYKRSDEVQLFLDEIEEVQFFPVAVSNVSSLDEEVYYENTWMYERDFQGSHGHEGTDILSHKNKNGIHPIVSMTDGTITNMGWLNAGGYRIGILSKHQIYYYYAHLDHYAYQIEEGNTVKAGQIIGYMGDTGYGEERTSGQFPVHLHVGIYVYSKDGSMISINPYHILKRQEQNILKYNE